MGKKAYRFMILTILALSPAWAWAQIELDFGVYTSDKPSEMVRRFRPLLRDLEARLTETLHEPVRIRIQVAASYEKGIDALLRGEVDFARLGPASYMEVVMRQPAVRILAVEAKKGAKHFNGVICVHRDSPIHTAADLKGKTFAFGDPRSTIGRYLSQQYLLTHGVKASDLADFEYLGRHDRVGYAVGAGQFDAGALKESTFKRLVAKGVPIRAIARLPNVTKPWVARAGLDEQVAGALQRALLGYRDPHGLKPLGKDGFLEGSERDYARIQAAIEDNDRFFQ